MAAPPREPAFPPPRMPGVPASDNEVAQSSDIEGVPPRYVYVHTPFPNPQFFNLDAYTKDRNHNNNFIPDLLTYDRTSTG